MNSLKSNVRSRNIEEKLTSGKSKDNKACMQNNHKVKMFNTSLYLYTSIIFGGPGSSGGKDLGYGLDHGCANHATEGGNASVPHPLL